MTKVRESALNSIREAFNRHSLPLDLVEPLAPAMPTMAGELLAHAVYIFGAIHHPQSWPLIEPFLQHPDADVREEARRAATEITASRPEGRIHILLAGQPSPVFSCRICAWASASGRLPLQTAVCRDRSAPSSFSATDSGTGCRLAGSIGAPPSSRGTMWSSS
ncbi:hypothetical protein OG535_40110 [Kitasatospora sp. NBC_00085]|uniref:hypothetical protein n=1 Tax=Kitasatospora sp. NBC_00085 TaxID=2903566 RepID=UPI0032509188